MTGDAVAGDGARLELLGGTGPGADLETHKEGAARWDAARAAWERGELRELTFRAVTFRTGPNLNHFVFRDGDLDGFGRSFAGAPFLRDHNTYELAARMGTVTASEYAGGEFVQTVKLTTREGLRAFFEGQIDRFSVGWTHDRVTCSVCGADWHDWRVCTHEPGRSYTRRGAAGGDETVTCELIFEGPRGKEVSAVNVPAVPGTGLLQQLILQKENEMKKGQGTGAEAAPAAPGEGQTVGAAEAGAAPAEDETVRAGDGEAGNDAAPTGGGAALAHAPEASDGRERPDPTALDAAQALLREARRAMAETVVMQSGLSPEGKRMVLAALEMVGDGPTRDQAAELVAQAHAQEAALSTPIRVVSGLRPSGVVQVVEDEPGRVQKIMDFILGVENAPLPPRNMRNPSDLYLWYTEDYDWYGRWTTPRAELAMNTGTLPAVMANSLQIVMQQTFENLGRWRWYEKIMAVLPHDGSLQDVDIVHVGGVSDLPIVPEGATYQEKTLVDQKETATFSKRGAYIGITLEMIRKDSVNLLRSIPRKMVTAAIRTRSVAAATLFTQASGVGPTMAYDSTALFHADHGNLATTAFSYEAWAAARLECQKQTELGSGKTLGLLPRFCLVPVDLFDTALNVFAVGYGAPTLLPGSPNNDLNIYSYDREDDPRPAVLTVPDWTDAKDWAYIVDPRVHPVLYIAYANMPGGGTHPTPEIFTVDAPNAGLMFSNDTMPIKIRDWWGVKASRHDGIGKRNVV